MTNTAEAVPTKASFQLRGYNPDVLTCIANLSNDEVFTPPELANEMLDVLADAWAESHGGANIWADPSVTFLDPFTKSGVFLREIVRRLTEGLANAFPDLQARVDHILTRQVFGIGVTQLTTLLARRSVYCSKTANGKYSITEKFDDEAGNIWFKRTEHTWVKRKRENRVNPLTADTEVVEIEGTGRCKYCGANEANYARDSDLESHAYAFIHTDDIKARMAELFGANMQFDVIIGNPPYQIEDGGASASARPIYHSFIEQAQNLDPHFLVMVTPSRWFLGGKGLDDFRQKMLTESRFRSIHDFIVANDAFPGVNVNGGVNYFLWDREHQGMTSITTIKPGGIKGEASTRLLNEFDVFIRRNEAVSILRKVKQFNLPSFRSRVSSRKPFGLPTNYLGNESTSPDRPIKTYASGKVYWLSESQLLSNVGLAGQWKVLIPAASDGNEKYPLPIWDQVGPVISQPGEACTETYLVCYPSNSKTTARNVAEYMKTKFFRFLVSLRKIAQHNKSDNFSFVPDLSMDRCWSDDDLYEHFNLSENEIAFIESQIRTMEFGN